MVCSMMGMPCMSSNCLGLSAPKRLPLPPASRFAVGMVSGCMMGLFVPKLRFFGGYWCVCAFFFIFLRLLWYRTVLT